MKYTEQVWEQTLHMVCIITYCKIWTIRKCPKKILYDTLQYLLLHPTGLERNQNFKMEIKNYA